MSGQQPLVSVCLITYNHEKFIEQALDGILIQETSFPFEVVISDDFAIEWSCIPHFYHTPFYCYAYSFGNLLALALFQRYKKEGSSFVPSYIDILAAGGSKKPEKLLAEHGLDIRSEKFWQDGFDYVQSQVKVLSTLN